jgi:two-component system, NarL family, nitrate/nitrite response regulator NarL
VELSQRAESQSQSRPDIGFSREPMITEAPHLGWKLQGQIAPVIAISIISNSHLLREGLFALLLPHVGVQLIGTYAGELPGSTPLPNPPGHVILLDSSIGREAAIKWTQYWRLLTPQAHIIILELVNNTDLILACIEAGASGYTLQGSSADEVADAIKAALSGRAHCSPEVTYQLFARIASFRTTMRPGTVSPLTARETEILGYIAAGFTNVEIASRLVIELRTVKQHVHHILQKLNAHRRWEAVRQAAEQGWITYSFCLLAGLICGILVGTNIDSVASTVGNLIG